VFEGGVLQIHHRISTPDAMAWTEQTRGMFGGEYFGYAFGTLADRCFPIVTAT
jgi:Icc protein